MSKASIYKIDFCRIANSASEAHNQDFIDPNRIVPNAWGDKNGEVEIVPMDNGTYLLEQDGIGMGYTDQKGYDIMLGESGGEGNEKVNSIAQQKDFTYDLNGNNYKNTTTNKNNGEVEFLDLDE